MRRFKVALSTLLLILLLVTGTAFAADKPGITYTALGDSIAYGTGGTGGIGYTDMFNTHLERIYGEGIFNKLAHDGLNSHNLLMALQYDQHVKSCVENADTITISIGGNDLLGPFLMGFAQVVINYYYVDGNINFEALLEDLAAWEENPLSQPQFNVMLNNLSNAFPLYVENFTEYNWPLN